MDQRTPNVNRRFVLTYALAAREARRSLLTRSPAGGESIIPRQIYGCCVAHGVSLLGWELNSRSDERLSNHAMRSALPKERVVGHREQVLKVMQSGDADHPARNSSSSAEDLVVVIRRARTTRCVIRRRPGAATVAASQPKDPT
jgi:hypothetical protein